MSKEENGNSIAYYFACLGYQQQQALKDAENAKQKGDIPQYESLQDEATSCAELIREMASGFSEDKSQIMIGQLQSILSKNTLDINNNNNQETVAGIDSAISIIKDCQKPEAEDIIETPICQINETEEISQ